MSHNERTQIHKVETSELASNASPIAEAFPMTTLTAPYNIFWHRTALEKRKQINTTNK